MGRLFLVPQTQEIQLKREKEIKVQAGLAIKRVALRYGMTQNQLALYLGTSPSCVSRVMNEHFDDISYDRLFRFVTRLAPNFKFIISV